MTDDYWQQSTVLLMASKRKFDEDRNRKEVCDRVLPFLEGVQIITIRALLARRCLSGHQKRLGSRGIFIKTLFREHIRRSKGLWRLKNRLKKKTTNSGCSGIKKTIPTGWRKVFSVISESKSTLSAGTWLISKGWTWNSSYGESPTTARPESSFTCLKPMRRCVLPMVD